MAKTMDTTAPSADKLEFSTFTRTSDGKLVHHYLTASETKKLLDEAEEERQAEDESKMET